MNKVKFLVAIVLFIVTTWIANSYDQVFPSLKLRYGKSYYFYDSFKNTWNTTLKLKSFKVTFREEGNFNNAANPTFSPTQAVRNDKIFSPWESKRILQSSPAYGIKRHPVKRKSNNIEIIYQTTDQVYPNGKLTTHTEYQPYTITWCGDGVRDNYTDPYGWGKIVEACDPGDTKNKSGWWNGGCSNSCQPVTIPTPPKCTKIDVKPTRWTAPLTSNMSCIGEHASSYKIVVRKGANVVKTINSKTGTYQFTTDGSYSAQCYVNNTVTSNACKANIIVDKPVPPKYDLALIKRVVGKKTGYKLGENVTFAITVTNQGDAVARNFTITDYIPAWLQLVSTDWSKSGNTASKNISRTLNKRDSHTVNITFKIISDTNLSIKNYAEISRDDGDDCDSTPDSSNGNSTWESTGLVDNQVGSGCQPGGDEDDHDVEEITIERTSSCTNLTATPNTWVNTLTSNLVCTWNNVSSYKIEVKNSSGAVVQTVNAASWQVDLNSPGTYKASCYVDNKTTTPAVCEKTLIVSETPVYDLALIKKIKGLKTVFQNGDQVTFTITVENQGNIDATVKQLVDYIPTGLNLSDTNWTETGWKAYYNTAIALKPNETKDIDIRFEVTETSATTIKNYAEISQDDGDDCDSTPDNLNQNTPGEKDGTLVDDEMRDGCNKTGDEDDHDVAEIKVVIPAPSIKIDKTDANPADKDGSTGNDTQTVDKAIKAVFKIRVTNSGTENLDTIVLTDAIAPNCAGTVTLPNTKPSTWLSWNVGGGNTSDAVLEPGEYFEYTCEKANTQSNYTNTATVKAKGVKTKKSVEDTDTTVVKVPGGGWWGWGGWSIYKCIGVSQSGSTVTCEWNSKTQSFYLKCGSTIKGPKNYTTKNGKHVANFTCTESAFQCYVYNQKNAPIEGRTWKTSSACRASSSSTCGNGIVESGEECDLWSRSDWGRCNKPGTPNACKLRKTGGWGSTNCKTTNSCVLTWPGWANTKFGPQGSVIIGHKQSALSKSLEGYPYIHNDSKYDIGFKYMCVKEVNNDSSLTSIYSNKETCVSIDGETLFGYERYYMAEERVGSTWSAPKVVTQYVLNDLIAAGKARPPQFIWNKNGIGNRDFGKGEIVTTVANELPGVISGLNPYKYYFAADYNVKVAKPSISTVGGGTSLVKSTDSGDVAKVTDNKSTNFVGTSASSDSKAALSSDVETVKNTNTQVVEEIKKDAKTIDTPKEVIKTDAVSTAKLEKYNGLDNVFIYKGADFKVSSITDDLTKLTKPRTYIVENGSLIIDKNIAANKNIAFVVRGWNIHIEDQVVRMDGTYITIKKNSKGWSFTAEESGKQLLVKGSLYGDVSNLVDNRYYISDDTEGLSVGTIVSFGSGLFTKPAPLVTQFTKEYITSTKVAR